MKRWMMGVLLLASPVVAEEKPVGFTSLIQGVLEFPGLNAQAGAFWDALGHGDFALGGSAALLRLGAAVDVRVGYLRHEPKIWGGSAWESPAFGLSTTWQALGLKPMKILEGYDVGLWGWKDWTKPLLEGWIGGLNLVHNF